MLQVELKELRTRHKFISTKQTMNRMLVTSLLTATQRIVAEIARCQAHSTLNEEPTESVLETLSIARIAVVKLTANEWMQVRPPIRNALRVLLLLPEVETVKMTAEWSEISLRLDSNDDILMTGEVVEFIAAMLLNNNLKAPEKNLKAEQLQNNTSELSSSEAAITKLVHKAAEWWIFSKRSLELSRLHAQLVVEQGRLDSACEERVRLIAQKTKASATERIGRKMLDFLLDYRTEWDARLESHVEYLSGLAIEASLCAAFLAYGTAFPSAARVALKRHVYADAISRSLVPDPGPQASLIECLLPMHDETPLHRLPPDMDRNSHFRESVLAAVVGSSTCLFLDPYGLALSWLDVHEGAPDHNQHNISYRTASTDRANFGNDCPKIESVEGLFLHLESHYAGDMAAASSLSVLLPQAGFPSTKAILEFRKATSRKGPSAVQRGSAQPAAKAVTICSATDPGLRTAVLAAAERGRLVVVTDVTSEEQLSVLPAALLLPPALKRLERPGTIDPMSNTDPRGTHNKSEGDKGSESLRIDPQFRLVLVTRQISPQFSAWLNQMHGISVIDFSVQAANEKILLAVLAAERPDLASEFKDLPREIQAAAQRAASAELELAERLIGSTGRIITDPIIFSKLKELRTLLIDTNAEVTGFPTELPIYSFLLVGVLSLF